MLGRSKRILAFSHIPKNAGVMVSSILRRTFGPRHVDVISRDRAADANGLLGYRARDLLLDTVVTPWVRSVGGHYLFPFEDYGRVGGRLDWFLFLRDPASRFLSHYAFHRTTEAPDADFQHWMNDRGRRNLQTHYLCGKQDAELAKRVLEKEISFVGFVEDFNASLLLMKKLMGLPELRIQYGKKRNAGASSLRPMVAELKQKFAAEIARRNALDQEVYAWARKRIWNEQVLRYGKGELERDAQRLKEVTSDAGLRPVASEYGNRLWRNVMYRPLVRLDAALGSLRD